LFSVGVADFRNTSAGPYRELVVAFPACDVEETPELECRGFVSCQSQLPDCAHTYMFRSFVDETSAIWTARSFGVDAQLASNFKFEYGNDTIDFSILGPGGSEVLQGVVQLGTAGRDNSSSDIKEMNKTKKLPRDGYNVHPYIGIPGVLGPGQARFMCAFSAKVSVVSVNVLGNLQAGPLLYDFGFKPEGTVHLPDVSVLQLPPWGHGGGPGPAPPSLGSQRVSPKTVSKSTHAKEKDPRIGPGLRSLFGLSEENDDVEMVDGGEPPRAPWVHAGSTQDSKPVASEDFPWDFHQDALGAPQDATSRNAQGSHRRGAVSNAARGTGAKQAPGLRALLSEL
jgi:hypothetical protein